MLLNQNKRKPEQFNPPVSTFTTVYEALSNLKTGKSGRRGRLIVEVLVDSETKPEVIALFKTEVEHILEKICENEKFINIRYYHGEGFEIQNVYPDAKFEAGKDDLILIKKPQTIKCNYDKKQKHAISEKSDHEKAKDKEESAEP